MRSSLLLSVFTDRLSDHILVQFFSSFFFLLFHHDILKVFKFAIKFSSECQAAQVSRSNVQINTLISTEWDPHSSCCHLLALVHYYKLQLAEIWTYIHSNWNFYFFFTVFFPSLHKKYIFWFRCRCYNHWLICLKMK